MIIALLVILLTLLCSGSFASFLMASLIYAIGHVFCSSIKNNQRDKAKLLFNIVFSCLTLFACIHYLDTVVSWNSFAYDWKDEYKFWLLSEEISQYSTIKNLFYDCFTYRNIGGGLIDNPGYVFYVGSLALISENWLDGNNLLLQFLGSVMFGSLSSIVLYKIFLLYFDSKKAFKYVLTFSLCSVAFSYGFVFLRDISIFFFFALIIYFVHKKFKVYYLVLLILLSFITFQLRFEHGLFSVIFIGVYLYKSFRKVKIMIPFFIIIAVFILYKYFIESIDSALKTMEMYSEFTENSAQEEGGLSIYIFRLPPIIKEIVLFLYVGMKPMPPWGDLISSPNIFKGIISLHTIIYELFWFLVYYLTFKWLVLNRKIKELPMDLIILIIVSIVFIVLNLSNPNHRRIMAVYPIIYIVYCYTKEYILTKQYVKNDKLYMSIIWVVLIILYLVIKFII